MLGKHVEIIVRESSPHPPAFEQEWEVFFARSGTGLIDADLVRVRSRPQLSAAAMILTDRPFHRLLACSAAC